MTILNKVLRTINDDGMVSRVLLAFGFVMLPVHWILLLGAYCSGRLKH